MIQNLLNPLFSWIDEKSRNKYYPFYLAIFAVTVSWFFACPRFLLLDVASEAWKTTLLKSQDLTNSLTHLYPGTGYAKKVFRLTVPFFMKIANLSPLMVIIIQGFIGPIMLFFSYKFSLRILKDSISATFLTLSLAFLYWGRVAYFDINFTWFDTFAYFFLLLAMYSNHVLLIFIFSLLAAWTDERAFIALIIVFIYHHTKCKLYKKLNYRDLFDFNKSGMSVILAGILYLATRSFLSYKFNMHTSSEGATILYLKKSFHYIFIGMWTFLEGFWIIYLIAIWHILKNKNHIALFCFLIPVLLITLVAGCVTDITRSGSYLVPILFIVIHYMKEYISNNEFRIVLFACFLTTFLFPAVYICAEIPLKESITSPSLYYLFTRILN